ncbi:MAG: alpha-amylase [Bacteroidales bacterium]|nr:alpha-amylase [Bacteroidales bacterium]
MSTKAKLKAYWATLYPLDDQKRLDGFLDTLTSYKRDVNSSESDWYKDAVVYSLYVDLYNKNFDGLTAKLDYLSALGVTCLWLLPILDSPMRDAGFDIRNYDLIRHELLGLPADFTKQQQESAFGRFMAELQKRNLRVIFDFPANHTSDEHPWFVEAKKSEDNPFRDYYIWSKDNSLYGDARILFKGMEHSNWEANGEDFFFHRFFSFQPDLNYRNPDVLVEMCKYLLYWQQIGVDGFRADAIPYLWKEAGTVCENLPNTHTIVKFFRAILDYVKPGTLLLAEACQQPAKVVEYMGKGDECQSAYHFPMMPMLYKAMAQHSFEPIKNILNTAVTPVIPENGQWFTFLRCHDELSLELVYVSEEDRKYIHENYCHEPEWNFRLGEGISARLANLLQFDDRRIGLAYSMMLSLPGTPVIYYGDEFGKENDEAFYHEMIRLTGKNDTRFYVRGKIDWQKREAQLKQPETFQARVFIRIQQLLTVRKKHKAFGRGNIEFLQLNNPDSTANTAILAYWRIYKDEKVLVIQNLADTAQKVLAPSIPGVLVDLLSIERPVSRFLNLSPFEYRWYRMV